MSFLTSVARSATVAGLGLLVSLGWAGMVPAAPLAAQGQSGTADSVLSSTARDFATHWAAGRADSLAQHLAPEGIRLHLDGPARMAIPPRQAVAAVREFLRGFDEGATEILRAAVAGGTEDQGFVEMAWTARVAGTSQAVEYTLFLSMARAGERWRVEELRLLR